MRRSTIGKVLSIILIGFIVSWPIHILFLKEPETKDQDINKEAQWQGVIRLWDFPRLDVKTGSRYSWIEDKIKIFERKNPGVYIELEPLDWDKGSVKLEVALKTGKLPDIGPIATDYEYMKDSILEPLDSFFTKEERDRFKYQSLKAVTYDNKMWGVPAMMTTYVMYLNLDLFKERGVEPPIDGNWTYEEFVKKMQKLTWDSNNDGKTDRYGFTSFVKPNYYNIWGIILSDGAEIIDEENQKYIFSDERAIQGINKLLDLKNKYKVTPDNFGLIDENKAWEMFYNNRNVAVYPTGTWALNVLTNLQEQGEGFNFTTANYPIGDRRLPISLNKSVSGYGIFKQQDDGKLKMCVKFLKFITEDSYQEELERLGLFPAKSSINVYQNNSKMKRIEDSLPYTHTLPKHKNWEEIDRILRQKPNLHLKVFLA